MCAGDVWLHVYTCVVCTTTSSSDTRVSYPFLLLYYFFFFSYICINPPIFFVGSLEKYIRFLFHDHFSHYFHCLGPTRRRTVGITGVSLSSDSTHIRICMCTTIITTRGRPRHWRKEEERTSDDGHRYVLMTYLPVIITLWNTVADRSPPHDALNGGQFCSVYARRFVVRIACKLYMYIHTHVSAIC